MHKILVANLWLFGNTSPKWYVHQVFTLKPHYWTAMSYPEWIFFKTHNIHWVSYNCEGGIWTVECVGRWFEHSGFYWFYFFLCFSWLFFDIVRVWFTGVEALSCVTSDEPHAFYLPFFINKVLYICTIDCSWPSDFLPFLRHLFVLTFCSSIGCMGPCVRLSVWSPVVSNSIPVWRNHSIIILLSRQSYQ